MGTFLGMSRAHLHKQGNPTQVLAWRHRTQGIPDTLCLHAEAHADLWCWGVEVREFLAPHVSMLRTALTYTSCGGRSQWESWYGGMGHQWFPGPCTRHTSQGWDLGWPMFACEVWVSIQLSEGQWETRGISGQGKHIFHCPAVGPCLIWDNGQCVFHPVKWMSSGRTRHTTTNSLWSGNHLFLPPRVYFPFSYLQSPPLECLNCTGLFGSLWFFLYEALLVDIFPCSAMFAWFWYMHWSQPAWLPWVSPTVPVKG